MKKIYSLIAVLLCSTIMLTGCNFSIKFGGKSTKSEDVVSNSNSNVDSNSNSNVESNSNSNTTSNVTNNSSTKKLKCSKDFSSTMSNGIKLIQDVDVDFNNDAVDKMIMDMNFELPSSLASQASTYYNTLKTQYDTTYGKYNGVTVTSNKTSDLKFSFRINLDYKNISSADKTAMGFVGSESYDVNKTAFEQQGYTCN